MNMALAADFKDEASLPSLNSTDWHDIAQNTEIIFDQLLYSLQKDETPSDVFFGQSPAQAVRLYQDLHIKNNQTTRLKDLRTEMANYSNEELAAVMHLETVRGILITGAHVIAERNQQNLNYGGETFDREARKARLVENLRTMQKLGWTTEDIRFLYSNVKHWPTFTPHPTKDKNKNGNQFLIDLTKLAENVPVEDRFAKLQDLTQQAVKQRLTPAVKDTYDDETDDALAAEATYVKGMLNYLEDSQEALDEVLGENIINLDSPDMHMDIAARDWHTGDADGKPVPATLLFKKRLLGTQMAIERNIEVLSDSSHPRLDAIKQVLAEFKNKIDVLVEEFPKGEEIKKFRSHSPEFQEFKDRYVNIFTGTQYKGQSYSNGPALTAEWMKDLREIAVDEACDSITRRASRRVSLRYRQNGMAMGRQELRHNSADLNKIFDNLYQWIGKNRKNVFESILDGVPLHEMNAGSQTAFLKRLVEQYGPEISGWLLEANPPSADPDDPEGWPREVLERFKVVTQCFNQNRMGAIIIAEAEPISVVQQQVLADAFGLKDLLHVALNESKETMAAAAENFATYRRYFGCLSLQNRTHGDSSYNVRPLHYSCVMVPQSDSQKANGLFIRPTQREAKKAIINLSYKSKSVLLEKVGTGDDPARGGMSSLAVPRINLAALPEPNTLDDDQKKISKQIVSFVSITHQGRDLSLRLGTREQVYDLIAGVFEEIAAASLAIDQKISRDVLLSPEANYKGLVPFKLKELSEAACSEYDLMRTRESHGEKTLGQKRVDQYFAEVSAATMSGMAGVGARPAKRIKSEFANRAKTTIDKPKITTLRAIGSAITNANSLTYADNSYTLGMFLEGLHKAYQAKEISKEDLELFWSDPFYMQQILPNALIGLARANYEHGFDQISKESVRWTAGTIMRAEKQDWHVKGKKMSDNLAFHTVLTLDAMKATALLEALARTVNDEEGGGFDSSCDEIMRNMYGEKQNISELKFGPLTVDRFPFIDHLRARAKELRVTHAMIHEFERRIDEQEINATDKAQMPMLHHIGCGTRASSGFANIEIILDHDGFESRPDRKPKFNLIRDVTKSYTASEVQPEQVQS